MLIKGKKRSVATNENGPPKVKVAKTEKNKHKSKLVEPKNLFKGKPSKPIVGKLPKAKGERSSKKEKSEAKPEKTDWNKLKEEKKELKLKRKKTKDTYEIANEAKKISAQLYLKRGKNKPELAAELYKLVKGDVLSKIVMAHDTTRIVQSLYKFASPPLRDAIFEQLLPLLVDMSMKEYAHFTVLKIISYSSAETKSKLVDCLMGNIVRLACHNISSQVLDVVYLTEATPQQKIYMRQEFYGDLYKKSKDNSVKELKDTYKEAPHMKAAILGSVKSNLDHVANKKLVDNSLVHAVLLEYLKECEEDKMEETVTMFSSLIPLMLTTKEGCEAAVLCFWHSPAKNRRAIVKVIKEHLVKTCTHEHGHVFIIAIVNALDDTKATKKALFDQIFEELQLIAANQWGRRVIEWFISPGDTNCFHPHFTAYIEKGLEYGKKDKELRRKEIFEQVEEPIAKAIADAPAFWFGDGPIGLVTANILNKLTSNNFTIAAQALVNLICNPDWTAISTEGKKENVTVEGIVHAGLHIALKKIIKHDADRSKENQETFGSILSNTISDEIVKRWLNHNRGCFILLNVIENNNEETTKPLRKLIKQNIMSIKDQSSVGHKLLIKKVENSV